MEPSILFCSSWNIELFNASGEKFLASYETYQFQVGKLFIGYEGSDGGYRNANSISYNLDADGFLQSWLIANKDVIPDYLGGEAGPCKCSPNPFARPEKHDKGCRYTWFNRNCSRWFRKIATLHAAYEYVKENQLANVYLVWVDVDCYFKQCLQVNQLTKIFGPSAVIYMRGQRAIPETGVMGFDLSKKQAHRFLKGYFNYYQTKRYRQYDRWDDSNIFYRVLKENPEGYVLGKDIASKRKKGPYNEVLEYSLLQAHLGHDKGKHGRVLGIMI